MFQLTNLVRQTPRTFETFLLKSCLASEEQTNTNFRKSPTSSAGLERKVGRLAGLVQEQAREAS